MPYRVQDILLVSSLYDSFTLEQDGRLNELIVGEFLELSLHQTPRPHACLERRPRRCRWRAKSRASI